MLLKDTESKQHRHNCFIQQILISPKIRNISIYFKNLKKNGYKNEEIVTPDK